MLLFDRERRGILSDLRQLGLGSISKILKFQDITSVEVGGEPYAFVFPRNMQELEKVIEYIMKQEIPFWIVGNGTKLLVKDGKLSRLVISLNRFDSQSEKNGKSEFTLTLGAGVSLQFVVAYGIKKGLEGVEKITGIPGCIGGAVKMNAGTRKGSISEFVENVDVLTVKNGDIKISKMKPKFGYRWSSIKDNQIVLSATLKFKKGKPAQVKQKVSQYLKKRFETQPVNGRNFGCIFKNPPNGESAGKIIEEVGLKGFRISKRVCISPIHANFIENEGGASFAEIDELINMVKDKVKEAMKIELEEEVIKLLDEQ